MDILELYHNDTSRLHPLLAVVSDLDEKTAFYYIERFRVGK